MIYLGNGDLLKDVPIGNKVIKEVWVGNKKVFSKNNDLYLIKNGRFTNKVKVSSIRSNYEIVYEENQLSITTPLVSLGSGSWDTAFEGAPINDLYFEFNIGSEILSKYDKVVFNCPKWQFYCSNSSEWNNVAYMMLNGANFTNKSTSWMWESGGAPGSLTNIASVSLPYYVNVTLTNNFNLVFKVGSRRDKTPRYAGCKIIINDIYLTKNTA